MPVVIAARTLAIVLPHTSTITNITTGHLHCFATSSETILKAIKRFATLPNQALSPTPPGSSEIAGEPQQLPPENFSS